MRHKTVDRRARNSGGALEALVAGLVVAGIAGVGLGVAGEHGPFTGLAAGIGLAFLYQLIRQTRGE